MWNPFHVQWGDKNLAGTRKKPANDTREINVWTAAAIYGLYSDYRLVYVGQSGFGRLGPRLAEHRTDRHAGRWDAFSFYSLSNFKADGTMSKPGQRQLKSGHVLNTLEALGIRIMDPPGNRRHEKIPGATELEQRGLKSAATASYAIAELRALLPQLVDGISAGQGGANSQT